eukprot:CAMPEP_0175657522 /NCGR_PEP_ID=MMETSP0097-20121207/12964_1 /TAXON_ID=311494 /ORGANISM="Alexandrium monilatum, Strain CCMP3105" /LENGTH=446 /DNA_ID=CAMNT_0016963621 /DNA_START=39 /DNA_END=1378 /DNA_ORIENTATION=-
MRRSDPDAEAHPLTGPPPKTRAPNPRRDLLRNARIAWNEAVPSWTRHKHLLLLPQEEEQRVARQSEQKADLALDAHRCLVLQGKLHVSVQTSHPVPAVAKSISRQQLREDRQCQVLEVREEGHRVRMPTHLSVREFVLKAPESVLEALLGEAARSSPRISRVSSTEHCADCLRPVVWEADVAAPSVVEGRGPSAPSSPPHGGFAAPQSPSGVRAPARAGFAVPLPGLDAGPSAARSAARAGLAAPCGGLAPPRLGGDAAPPAACFPLRAGVAALLPAGRVGPPAAGSSAAAVAPKRGVKSAGPASSLSAAAGAVAAFASGVTRGLNVASANGALAAPAAAAQGLCDAFDPTRGRGDRAVSGERGGPVLAVRSARKLPFAELVLPPWCAYLLQRGERAAGHQARCRGVPPRPPQRPCRRAHEKVLRIPHDREGRPRHGATSAAGPLA